MDESFRFFDPEAEFAVTERRLPHWAQAGTLCFLTWRTWDSIPGRVLAEWLSGRGSWLARHGIDPLTEGWRTRLALLPAPARAEFHRTFSGRWHAMLDESHGACVLKRPEVAGTVAESLRHFDGDRYTLTDFVVMPNHVHVLAAFSDEALMLAQCESWKHFTAVRINKALGRAGRFWQADGFDHLVRGAEQFDALRRYIADNPRRAGLAPGEFIHYSRELTETTNIGNGHSRSERPTLRT
jgi:type I restriction enzyme R subunit